MSVANIEILPEDYKPKQNPLFVFSNKTRHQIYKNDPEQQPSTMPSIEEVGVLLMGRYIYNE